MKILRERRLLPSSALFLSIAALAACSDEWAPHPHVALPASACAPGANSTRLPGNCFDLIAEFDGNRSFDPTKWNDWWHDRPDRAFPRWMSRNRDCARRWYSGDVLTC